MMWLKDRKAIKFKTPIILDYRSEPRKSDIWVGILNPNNTIILRPLHSRKKEYIISLEEILAMALQKGIRES